jgi:hypothetical protein
MIPSAVRGALAVANGARTLPCGIGRGIRLEIDFAQHTGLYFGLYEVELNASLRRLCMPGTSSFDVGGHFGYDALILAKISGGVVRSFECEPLLAKRMEANLALNPALAARIELSVAYVGGESDASHGKVTLDDAALAADGFIPGFVKIDVEGAEADVLRGSQVLLSKYRPALVIETHSPQLEQVCQEILVAHGYRPRVVNARRFIPDHRPTEHNRWLVAAGARDGAPVARGVARGKPAAEQV